MHHVKVVVCLKQVTDLAIVQHDSRQETFPRHIPNPLDLIAVEEALRVCAVHGGEVIALTVGPPQADTALRKALMMGVNRAVRVWDEHLEGSDPFVIAPVLARAAQTIGFDLLLCGARSADTGAEVMGALLAECLDLPLITRVVDLQLDTERKRIVAHKKVEKGGRETYAAFWPAVVTIEQGLTTPRYCGPQWLRRGLKRRVEALALEDIGPGASLRPFDRAQGRPSSGQALPLQRVRSLEVMPPRPRTKVGVRVSGLSLKEKLMIMRGQVSRPQGGGIVNDPPQEAARKIKEHLEKWLG